MSVEFTLPELGENIEKGDVVRVLVKVGDLVAKDQPVVELETDKATIEVPSSVEGRVSEIRVKAGDKVKVGQAVLVLDSAGAAKAEPAPKPVEKTDPTPAGGEGRTGASQPARPRSRERWRLQAAAARPRQSSTSRAPAAPARRGSGSCRARALVAAAPSVRRYARELGVDIGQVAGTGLGRRMDRRTSAARQGTVHRTGDRAAARCSRILEVGRRQ
jgi:pyruvate dehydrogenase E2 component (dihydrolipoamide acetyltransferase)